MKHTVKLAFDTLGNSLLWSTAATLFCALLDPALIVPRLFHLLAVVWLTYMVAAVPHVVASWILARDLGIDKARRFQPRNPPEFVG